MSSNVLSWTSDAFAECYDLISLHDGSHYEAVRTLKNDLVSVLVTPPRSDNSRNKLIDESKPVVFGNGDEYKLNRPFIEICVSLAGELNLDEIAVAELVYYANNLSFQRGTNLGDSAKLAYFSRAKYILNIVGYLVTNHELEYVLDTSDYEVLFNNILASYTKVYDLIGIVNDLIDKQRVSSDINNLSFVNSINFIKNQLFMDHELLGQILYSLFDQYFDNYGTVTHFTKVVDTAKKNVVDDDNLIIHYIPGILKYINQLVNSDKADLLYKYFTTTLETDYNIIADTNNDIDLSKSKLTGIDMISGLVFFTLFIGWCKQSESRTAKYDFKDDILKYMEWLISYGAFERLLSYSADTATPQTEALYERSNVYDFRALLQKLFPRLVPVKFVYPSSQDLIYTSSSKPGFENVSILLDTTSFRVSSDFNNTLVAPFLHLFFSQFISNAAIILTSLRDSEEDFVLSSLNGKQDPTDDTPGSLTKDDTTTKSDGLDLDEIAARADLERFYLAFAYTYNHRPELCGLFWSDDVAANDISGFIAWGLSNNTSPLITATFCLLLGSITCGGNDTASQIWETLVHNNGSSLKKSDYSKISIDSICDSLNYYIDSLQESFELDLNEQLKQRQKKHEFRFSSSSSAKQDLDESVASRIIIELAEDSVVFISGFFQLVSAIVTNLSSTTDRSREIKSIIFNRFLPIVTAFLKFDNLITGGSLLTVLDSTNKHVDLPRVLASEDNRIVLTNLILNFLGSFIGDDHNLDIRYQIWRLVDRWVYHGLYSEGNSGVAGTTTAGSRTIPGSDRATSLLPSQSSKPKYSTRGNLRILQGFDINLVHLSQVTNFVNLIGKLLEPLDDDNEAFRPYTLLYPADLGSGYRINNQIGIWPYIEYLLVTVFSRSGDISGVEDRLALQTTIVNIITSALKSVDWTFISDTVHQLLRSPPSQDIFDSLLPTVRLNYDLYVKLHHSVAILNYLFYEKTWSALFTIVNAGTEAISSNSELRSLVESSLIVLDEVLQVQHVFLHKLVPILKNQSNGSSSGSVGSGTSSGPVGFGTSLSLALAAPKSIFDNIYLPKALGTTGTTDFYEIYLYNLVTVAHFGLYVGIQSPGSRIASVSLSLLNKIRTSPYFVTKIPASLDPVLVKNRLLTTFESIDESEKIKYAFISVFDTLDDRLDLKYKVLEFLLANLNQAGNEPNVAHFLLGYEIRGGTLSINQQSQQNTLLKSLLETLSLTFDIITHSTSIDVGPVKLSSLILEIVIKLSHEPLSSGPTVAHLRDQDNLFEQLISYQPKLDIDTLWNGIEFNGDLRDGQDNNFIESYDTVQAFFAFISQRNLILQYLTLEFHHITSRSKKEYYMELLLDNKDYLSGTPKVLSFLDVLNYNLTNFEIHHFEAFDRKYNLSLILETVQQDELDLSVLNKVFKYVCQTHKDDNKTQLMEDIVIEGNRINEFIVKYLTCTRLKELQLSFLHSWCQLVEILITDHNLYSKKFILEILQVILPKINDYLESDIAFSEELISLSVLLFDLYDHKVMAEVNSKEDFALGMRRLIPLLKTSITGILNSNSVPTLRSDLYILANKFLIKVLHNEELVIETAAIIKSIDKKFIDVITSDAIYSEGASRITSILLLESLVHVSSLSGDNFVLECLVKSNSLLLLMRSIKRTDEVLEMCENSDHKGSGIGLDTLIYELTSYKSTLYLLIRVAQSKAGSLQLIQGEIFSLLKQSRLLSSDPDLGLTVNIDEHHDLNNVRISLQLDTPLGLRDVTKSITTNKSPESSISLIELIIPIFQLVVTILLAMGPSYKPSIIEGRNLLTKVNRLVVGVVKRDLLSDDKPDQPPTSLQELVRLFTLLESLVNYTDNEE
ncbi:nucleoporin Nup186/Nup192/Nup205 [Scheffersomyces amazonensis]|uniref:nucleoporin Nup186/Nup192/Nup205 n=1 Tax=Scheffersomyces amazonensis TaxID=1078765 RepID=UPI00315D1783